jgi:hypothetical protein
MHPSDQALDPEIVALRDADAATLRRGLRALADQAADEHPAVDEDRLLSLGVALGRARRDEVAVTMLEWLGERPAPERLDVAAVILRGAWKPRQGAAPVDSGHVAALLDVSEAVRGADEAADASLVLALATAVQEIPEGPVRARAMGALRAASEQSWRHPGVRATLASLSL